MNREVPVFRRWRFADGFHKLSSTYWFVARLRNVIDSRNGFLRRTSRHDRRGNFSVGLDVR
jgi:hypothetical protein